MRTAFIAALAVLAVAPAAAAQPFELKARDGQPLHGQVDRPEGEAGPPRTVVLMVPGTGLFDRDVRFGRSNTEADALFRELSDRITARGVSTLRHDLRGVGHGDRPADRAVLVSRTTRTMRDDMADLYAWARDPQGLGARCVILFGHSEGMLHIGRLADAGEPAPLAVVGMGALLESPAAVMRWQLGERNVQAVRAMDANADGVTSNDEVRAGFAASIGSVMLPVEAFIQPGGQWGEAEITAYRRLADAQYEMIKSMSLAKADGDPYPDAANGFASYQWWKSWFTDDRPVAAALARWNVPVLVHYGDRDSQTDAARQAAAAGPLLGERLRIVIHPGLGHGMGEHVTVGPMDPAAADAIADTVADAAKGCA